METLESFPKSHEGLARKTIGGNILVYMFCQKHIIKGVAAGAVKG